MVETSPSLGQSFSHWYPHILSPLQNIGRRISDFFSPAADAAHDEECYHVNMELPGVDQENITIDLRDGVLTIKGEKTEEKSEQRKDYFFSERSYGAFTRSFRLPTDADSGGIAADYKDGVLSIRIPKLVEKTPSSKQIPING